MHITRVKGIYPVYPAARHHHWEGSLGGRAGVCGHWKYMRMEIT